MTIVKSGLFSRMSKSFGNTTFACDGNRIVMKKKMFRMKNNSPKQVRQQLNFKFLNRFCGLFKAGLEAAFPSLNYGQHRNMFVKMNMEAVVTSEDNLFTEVFLTKFLCSDGDLIPPNAVIVAGGEDGVYDVEYFKQSLSPDARHEDNVYVMFLAPGLCFRGQKIFYLGKRNEPKKLSFSFKGERELYMFAYVFAVSANGRRCSKSVCFILDFILPEGWQKQLPKRCSYVEKEFKYVFYHK